MADGKVTIAVDLDGKQAQGDVNTLKRMLQGLGDTGSKVGSVFKSVLGANLISGAFMSAIGSAKSGMSALMGEAVAASDTLYKFEQTMGFGGYDGATIKQARADVKKYADETVYDIEDIANTTAQLASNGITNFKQLTESAGNLNAVAGGNANTFKTVGMVMTQTAGAGKLTTENWNQLSNAIPGASGKLQEAMLKNGAYTGNFRKAMEKGEISAEEFNAAIIELGEGQKEAATNTATAEGAIGNLRATISTGLLTVIDKVKPRITEMINSFSGLAGRINFEEIANKLDRGIAKVGQFFDKFKDTGALSAAGKAFEDIGRAVGNVFKAFSGGKGDWTDFGTTLGNIVTKLSEGASAIANFVAKLDPGQIQAWTGILATLVGGFKLFNLVTGSSPIGAILGMLGEKFSIFGQKGEEGSKRASRGGSLVTKIFNGLGTVITKLGTGLSTAFKGLGTGLATAFKGLGTGISTAAQGIGTAIATVAQGFGQAAAMANPAQWLSMGAAMLMVGAGVALVAGGIYILVQAAIQLASAGWGAALALGGLVVAIGAMAGIFALLGPALTAGAVGILAFGAAVALIGAGIAIAAYGLSILVNAFANAEGAITATGQAISTAAQGIGQGLQSAFNGAAQVVESFGTAIKSALDGVANVFISVGNAIKSAFEGIGSVIQSVGNSIRTVLDGISGVIDSIGRAALNAGKGFNQLANGVVKITNLNLFDMGASLAAVATGLGAIAAHGAGLTTVSTALAAVSVGLAQLGSGAASASAQLISLASGTQIVISAFHAMRGQVQSSMQAMLSAVRSTGNQMKSQGRQMGQQTAQNIAQGIRSGVGQTTSAMQALINATRSVGASGAGTMRSIGAMMAQGLAQGMYAGLGAVTAAANALVAQAERAARAKAQIHSPSRLFRDSIGRFLPMGVAVGIEKNTKYVDKAMDGMYDRINSFSFKAEDVMGVGSVKLSKAVQVKTDLENAVKATIEVAKEKSNNLIERALDVAEKAVQRPTEMVLDDGTLVAKTGNKFADYQSEQIRRANRMKGIIT
ncbi:TPA: tape measure protein [Streptococcus suis]|nr:tape measure protein [Streptococcus suis]